MKSHENSNPFKFGTAEKKILIVTCYCIVLSTVALTAFTLSTRDTPAFVRNIGLYFLCEQRGHDPENPCSRDYIKNSDSVLTMLSFVLLSLFPVVNLIYAINTRELKEFMQRMKSTKNKRFSSNTQSTMKYFSAST